MKIVYKFKLVLLMIFSFSVIFFSIYAYTQNQLEQKTRLSFEINNMIQRYSLSLIKWKIMEDIIEKKMTKKQEDRRFLGKVDNFLKNFYYVHKDSNYNAEFTSPTSEKVDIALKEYSKQIKSQLKKGLHIYNNISQTTPEEWEAFKKVNDEILNNRVNVLPIFNNHRANLFSGIGTINFYLSFFAWALFVFSCVLLIIAQYCLRKYLTNPIEKLTSDIDGLSKGDMNLHIKGIERSDEIGDIARALNVIRTTSIEVIQLKKAADTVSVGIIAADKNGLIVYHNHTILELMNRHKMNFVCVFQDFNGVSLIGQHVDFLKPHDTVLSLADMDERYEGRLQIGTCVFNIVSHPSYNELGDLLGIVIEVMDLSEEVLVENELASIVGAAALGEISVRLNTSNKRGFMQQLSVSMNALMNNTEKVINDIGQMFTSLAQGDFTVRLDDDYQGAYLQLKDNALNMTQNLSQIINDLIASAAQVYNAVAEISVGSQDLSQRTEQQTTSLKAIAESIEHIAAMVRYNSHNAERARSLAGESCDVAKTGQLVVTDAVVAMNKIATSSTKIFEIINVIDEIATQTELLALNAAVEAARAGEAGKGFSVVSENVSKLANRSAIALQQIKALVAESANHVSIGVHLVNLTGQSLENIYKSTVSVAELTKEIAKASVEQSAGIEEVNHAVTAMDAMNQQNTLLVQESLNTAMNLQEQADHLTALTGEFRL